MKRRTVTLGNGMVLIDDEVASGVHLTRFLPDATTPYDKMVVIAEEDGGRALFLQGWIGEPVRPRVWRMTRDALFPAARILRWVRHCYTTGAERLVELSMSHTI